MLSTALSMLCCLLYCLLCCLLYCLYYSSADAQLGMAGGPSASAGFSSLKFWSLNESVAAVDPETGLVTAVAEGVAVSGECGAPVAGCCGTFTLWAVHQGW